MMQKLIYNKHPGRSGTPPKATGHVWASLRPELMWIYEARVPPGRGDFHDLRERQVSAWLIRQGWGRIEIEGKTWEGNPGDWIICQARELDQSFSKDAQLLSIRCLLGWPNGRPLFSGGPVAVFPSSTAPRLERRSVRLSRLRGHVDWERPAAYLQTLTVTYSGYLRERQLLTDWIEALFGALARSGQPLELPSSNDARVNQACLLLDSLPPGEVFPARDLVHLTGLTIGHLNRLCAQEHGCTLQTYRERRRLERAKHGVSDPSRPIKETAHELGFVQLSHFSAWFKKGAGVSPRRFRELCAARRGGVGRP